MFRQVFIKTGLLSCCCYYHGIVLLEAYFKQVTEQMINQCTASKSYKDKGMQVHCPSFVATFRIESLFQADGA